MVHQIVKLESKYRIFIETLVLTLLILIIGFSIGFYVESYRANSLIENYKNLEVEALDLKLQSYYFQIMDVESCEVAINGNFEFADRIYDKGLQIEKYEDASELLDNIILEKKKYALLKNELWLNSILLKEKCNSPFHTITYFYMKEDSLFKEAEQKAISDNLKKLKEEFGNSIVLLPIAGDLDLQSIELQMKTYNITYLPSIVINEEIVLEGYQTKEEIQSYLN